MDPRDESRRQADLDWLYGSERPSADQTRVMDSHEIAELDRRRRLAASAATTGARAAQAAREDRADDGTARRRVVHTEDEVAASRPAPRPAAATRPAPARPTASRPAPSTPRPAAPRPAAEQPVPARRPPRPRRRRGGVLRWLVLALVAWLAWLVAVPVFALATGGRVQEQPVGERPPQQPGTTTLLVGSDARENLSAAERRRLGTGSEVGKRTDTMMLLYTPPSGRPALVSLPRDSYVRIPGHGRNKLNAAYAFGGPQLLVETIEQDTGLRVDNYLEVGFDGFADVVDAVGGVRMCLDAPMVDKDSHTNLPAGCQKLDGTSALGYVRMRKADPRGDIGRMERQRQMIAAIVSRATSPMTFVNPVRYWRLNMALANAVRRGQDTGLGELAATARGVRGISGGGGLALSVPLSDTNATTAAGSSVLWDDRAAAEMFGRMASGSTEGLEKYAR